MKEMKKTELDEIGKAFVKASAVSTRELEQIVANPALFDSIRKRIIKENAPSVPRRRSLRPVIAVFGSVSVIAAVAAVSVITIKRVPETVVRTNVPPVSIPAAPKPAYAGDVKKSDKPDQIAGEKLSAEEPLIKSERVSTRSEIRGSRDRTPVAQPVSHTDDFYAVSYAGDPNETERGARIVRVDIPRSTLFAMGVDIPLENESETVKADLLVGNDGVTRAIRVVK